MTRLRELGLGAGAAGPANSIADVAGVQVGHVDIRDGGLVTGLTAVVPYPVDIAERKLFIGRFAVDGGEAMTGLGVAEDFGTFSSPIVLAPAPAVGRVYEGLIAYGLDRDAGLSTETGWPPVVVGVDDTGRNDAGQTYAAVAEDHLAAALANAAADVAMGAVGIGGGLQAFGYQGGVGTASREVADYTVGALVAVNGGDPGGLRLAGYPLPPGPGGAGPQNFALIVATDAPLIPRQLDRLAGRAALGLAQVGLWSPSTREGLALAFATTGMAEGSSEGPATSVKLVGEEGLYPLFGAAAAAAAEAVVDGLLAAAGGDVGAAALTPTGWPEEVRRFMEAR